MKLRKFFLPLLFCFLIISIHGCTSNEIGESKDVAQETIFQQYNIKYNEGDENVTINAIFRFAGDNGTTLVLTKPSSVQFDGIALTVDSSEFEGAFYRKNFQGEKFFGNHQFRFIDINKKKYDNNFSFNEFRLINIPESAPKNEVLQIKFIASQLGSDDYIELGAMETDSAFSITYSGKDTSGFLTIPVEELKRQKEGQIKLASTLYKKMSLQQNTTEGGILEIAYVLKPVTIKLR